MKRDMELIRKILLAVEASDGGYAPDDLKIDGFTDNQVSYHSYLIGQAELAQVIDVTNRGSSGPAGMIRYLTWDGHEFLDASRDPTTWETAKKTLRDTGRDLGNVTLAVLQALLIETTKRSLGLS